MCNTCIGDSPYPMDIVRIFNFSNEICKRYISLLALSYSEVHRLRCYIFSSFTDSEKAVSNMLKHVSKRN